MKIDFLSPRFFSPLPSLRICRVLFVGLLVFSAVFVGEILAEPEESELEVFGVLRASPPKELSEKIMAVARKVAPGPQVEALPFILGGMLGDPMLESFSPVENIGVALFGEVGTAFPVILLKLSEESPLRHSLPNLNLRLHEAEGWTFALPADQSVDLIRGAEEKLIAAVREKRQHDLELSVRGPVLADVVSNIPEIFGEHFSEVEGFDDQLMKTVLEKLTAELSSAEQFLGGLDLSPETIRQTLRLTAAAGSPLGSFLDQKRADDFGFARFLPGNEWMFSLGGFDVEATRNYFDHLFGTFAEIFGAEQQELLQEIKQFVEKYLESTDGRSGGGFGFSDGEMRMAQISSTKLTDSELVEMIKGGAELMERFALEGFTESNKQELLLNQYEVNGIAVHTLRSEIQVDAEMMGEEEFPAGFGGEQELHYAVVENYLVNASTLPLITELIAAIQTETPLDENLASKIELGAEELFAVRVETSEIVKVATMFTGLPEGMDASAIEMLPPLTASVSARNGSGRMEMRIPVDLLAIGFQIFSQQMQSEQELFLPEE